MKNHTIKTPTAELLILEMPKWFKDYSYKKPLLEIRGNEPNLVEFLYLGRYDLLGKPDEISEEEAEKLFYNPIDSANLTHYANLRNLFSLIESEIYWENPLANEIHAPDIEEWNEAEQKTFDRNRSLIFKKNKQ